ncbi:hypothetical protein CAEBREN_17121 [Caenorhabditis brenneri]|uniref:Uncharacterized protein n=1 Tax=Caenorhabditis brenneri TaxID=135651 RepID=G0N498_CAEBE|nr:hypothetical protein CAEBREN_17121 [Caenorhabditis brenneri]
MISQTKLVLLLGAVAIMAHEVNARISLMPPMCSTEEMSAWPCMCCRKACWYGVSEITTTYFGNIPGKRSDSEARLTIGMMSQCFNLECADVC